MGSMERTYSRGRRGLGLDTRRPFTRGRVATRGGQVFPTSMVIYLLAALAQRWPGPWLRIGDAETALLSKRIRSTEVKSPIYISGLARSGSTILLEVLASIDGVISHRYRDYPLLHIPFLWDWLSSRLPWRDGRPVERPHRDGIWVTPESPESFEEILWMIFFPSAHDPGRSSVLGWRTHCPAFERWYGDHLRKLLFVRKGKRYVAKANYNLTRLQYLLKLFPDARFVVPVRDPAAQIASLMRQHALFRREQAASRRVLEYMRHVGHFEFGLDRRPINVARAGGADEVLALWERGEELRGWARYWSQVYRYVAEALDEDRDLRSACFVVRFEELCAEPVRTIRSLLRHCRLRADDRLVRRLAEKVRYSHYYRPEFSAADMRTLQAETAETAARFGYDAERSSVRGRREPARNR